MELPVGIDPECGEQRNRIIELKKLLHRLKQASLNWFKMLKEGLEQRGYQSSGLDP